MALLKCYECGKDVSDRATACPHCSAPVELAINAPSPVQSQTAPCENEGADPSSEFFIWDGNEQSGPFTLDQMRQMYLNRQIDDQTLYARRGMPKWTPVERVFNELFHATPKSRAIPPPMHQNDIGPSSTPSMSVVAPAPRVQKASEAMPVAFGLPPRPNATAPTSHLLGTANLLAAEQLSIARENELGRVRSESFNKGYTVGAFSSAVILAVVWAFIYLNRYGN